MASDSRTNAGYDQVNVCRKMHTFATPGESAFVILTSGSLSLTQSVVTLLQEDFRVGRGLAAASSMYEAARAVGACVRAISEIAASKYAVLSMDATMRSNVTVGPPIELLQYRRGSLSFESYRRFFAGDVELELIHGRWEQALRRVVEDLPNIHFSTDEAASTTA